MNFHSLLIYILKNLILGNIQKIFKLTKILYISFHNFTFCGGVGGGDGGGDGGSFSPSYGS